MTAADIQQLQYAFSKAQERNEELQAQLKEAQAHANALVEMVLKHEATIAALTAERDELAAKLAAIPIYALKCYWEGDDDGNDPAIAEKIVGEWIISL